MEVTVAKSAGFCFGVKRAMDLVNEAADKREAVVYTMGPIIHNEQVVGELKKKGVRTLDDSFRDCETGEYPDPENSVIILRSHGVSRDAQQWFRGRGYRVINATCPFVQKIHDIVSEMSDKGYHILITGNPTHPEVEGIRGWAGGSCTVIASAEEAEAFSAPLGIPLCMVSQTTFNNDKFQECVEIIRGKGYDVDAVNTICSATKKRQSEALTLVGASDYMIVIGGKNSSNTQKLYEICRNKCENTYYIQKAEDLRNVHFRSDSRVGITAGASTPNNIIREVSSYVRGTYE